MAKNHLNLPTHETQNRMANALETLAGLGSGRVDDYSDAPGGKVLLAGTRENGFYGFVQPHEFGDLLGNPEESQDFNGTNLAVAVGLAQGTSQFANTPWMKFSRGGQILFVPVKPIRHTVSWNSIYSAGAVYGDGTVGINPANGRAGQFLSVDGPSNSFMIEPDAVDRGFLMPSGVLAAVGDTIVARGFANAVNNGEFVVTSISDTQVFVDGDLTTEPKGRNSASLYEKNKAVVQDKKVKVGNNEFAVRLLKGGASDPANYGGADRGLVGPADEWNSLILPMHEKAKLGNWAYKAHAGDVEDWGFGLTDADLMTHNRHGRGSYSWMQETTDTIAWARLLRGNAGASHGANGISWYAYALGGWRPCLALLS